MPGAMKACPRCNTPAPIDASFCGQCGRQYRTQFTADANAPPGAIANAPMNPHSGPAPFQRTDMVANTELNAHAGPTPLKRALKLVFLVGGVVVVAAVILFGIDAYKRRLASQPLSTTASSGSVQSRDKTAPTAVTPPPDMAPTAQNAPTQEAGVDAAARAAVERENQKLNLAPPPGSVDQNGMIHLRGGGVISQKQWDEASRKLETSPVFQSPPPPPPF